MTPKLHLYIHSPQPIFKARVNMASVTYPLQVITYDGVTLGAYTDIEFDMTLLLGTTEGADDLGRVRVQKPATATQVMIARSSQGIEDGTIDVQDNAYITVLNDFRVWAKLPYFDVDAGLDYKDGDILPGTNLTDMPPVANCGSAFADFIDPITEVITVELPNEGLNTSFAVTDGATITGYAWDVKDGTITVGTATDASITATFPVGFRYVALTVTDSNGHTHSARVPVLAVAPGSAGLIKKYQLNQRLEAKGQTLEIDVFEELDRDTYPDGSLVLFWWDAPDDPGSRDHMKFVGWIQGESYGTTRIKKGLTKTTSLRCVDVNGRLSELPGFPQALSRIEDESPWSYMPSLDMNKSLHYLIHWHSTALNLADFILPSTGASYDAMRIDAGGATLYEQVNQQAGKMVPDHVFTCNTKGQMVFRKDWRLEDEGDRPAVSHTITEDYWNEMRIEYSRHPKVYSLRSAAILSSTALDEDDLIPVVVSIAPGNSSAFGQGTQEQVENEGLALSQDALNKAEGHRYAMLNSRFGDFTFSDPSGSDFWNYEPAELPRVQLNISEAKAAYRELGFTTAIGLVKSIAVAYNSSVKGTAIQVQVVWTKEVSGFPALTYVPEEAEDVGYTPPPASPFVPNDPNNPDELFGDISAYVLWDGTDVLRTWDLQAASPTWERIDTGITGTIWDCQYMMVDADTVGAWLLSGDGIFFCGDVMAATPTWENVLPIATVRATAVAPTSGNVIFGGMTHYWSQPGHLCVAMSLDTEDDDYLHSYYWITEDYGASWTPVDVTEFTYTSDSLTRCYYRTQVFGLASFRTSPGTIWCLRDNGRTNISNGDAAVFKSVDLGYTWTKEAIVATTRATDLSIMHPYPNADSPCYLMVNNGGSAPTEKIWKSTDGWATATLLTPPASHLGGFTHSGQMMRPNKNPFDDLHALCLFRIDGSSNADLYETTDGGATWDLLDNMNNSVATPNGWPPDILQWVVVDDTDSPRIQLTLDNFATYASKVGNLAAVLSGGTWNSDGIAGGFALPKVGANDPGIPFPGMGRYGDSYPTYEYLGRTIYKELGVASTDGGSVSNWLMLHPPANAVRIRVEGTYQCDYTKLGGFVDGSARFELHTPLQCTMTHSLADYYVAAPENGSASGTFWAEWVLDFSEWPVSAEEAESTPPTNQQYPALRAYCISTSENIITSVSFTCRVTELELDDATVYEY